MSKTACSICEDNPIGFVRSECKSLDLLVKQIKNGQLAETVSRFSIKVPDTPAVATSFMAEWDTLQSENATKVIRVVDYYILQDSSTDDAISDQGLDLILKELVHTAMTASDTHTLEITLGVYAS